MQIHTHNCNYNKQRYFVSPQQLVIRIMQTNTAHYYQKKRINPKNIQKVNYFNAFETKQKFSLFFSSSVYDENKGFIPFKEIN